MTQLAAQLENRPVIRVDCNNLLPYSIVFDFIIFFKDKQFENAIKNAFENYLPKLQNYKSSIDLWVDLESSGEITVLMAKHLSQLIKKTMQIYDVNLVALQMQSTEGITRDNHFLIKYLQKETLVTIEENLSLQLNSYDCLPYYSWVSSEVDDEFDYTLGTQIILNYAWRCAALGAEQIAFKMLESGIQLARLQYLENLYLVQLQFMRIASQYYLEAARETRKISNKFSSLAKTYYLTKAWGSILDRRIDTAGHYFQLANVTMELPVDNIESLYRLNIFALFQHLNGNINNAFSLEKKIYQTINDGRISSPQIHYINSINLARLYRYTGDYSSAQDYYHRAFSSSAQTKSDSSFIYANACYGMLYEKTGEHNKALEHWLLVVLFWLSADTPEALGWRAVRAIALPNYQPRTEFDIHIITEALHKKLLILAKQNNLFVNVSRSLWYCFSKDESEFSVTDHVVYKLREFNFFIKEKSCSMKEINSFDRLGIFAFNLLQIVKGEIACPSPL